MKKPQYIAFDPSRLKYQEKFPLLESVLSASVLLLIAILIKEVLCAV